MKRTVGIIGTGWVGASVAISTLQSGVVDELLLYDVRADIAEGEAMDLAHGASFYPSAQIRTASIEEMKNADVIVVTAGRAGSSQESRLDLLHDNIKIIRGIGERLYGYDGVIIVLTNPVDILTRAMAEASGLPASRVISAGTMLDTARLKQNLACILELDPHCIHAQVVGEHGDSEVVLWSSAYVGGIPLKKFPGWNMQQATTVENEVRNAAYNIIQKKGATNHAVGLVTADLLKCILRNERRILTVSRIQEGALGLHGVALSLPTVVGSDGAVLVLEPDMDATEKSRLLHSTKVLRDALLQLGTRIQ